MIVLAIDTCFNRCAACLYHAAAGRVLAAEQLVMERGHAEALAPMVERVLAKAGAAVSDVSRVAVTTGPGTFTGLRIGLSFARAFGLARAIPVIGLDSLHTVALSVAKDESTFVIAHKAGQSGFHYVLRSGGDKGLVLLRTPDLVANLSAWKGLLLGTSAEELFELAHNADIRRDHKRDLPGLAQLAAFASAQEFLGTMPEPTYLREADAKPQMPARALIRQALATDLAAVAALHQLSFPRGWNEDDFASLLSVTGTQILVIEVQGTITGIIALRTILGESEILTLAVAPDQRQRGLGTQLLDAALAKLRDMDVSRMFLEVSEYNAAALALYKSRGFFETGRRKAYYAEIAGPEDAIQMAKALP